MTSESQAYIYVQPPGTLNTVPAALLKVEKLRDGTFVGRFRYGDRYLERKDAVEFDPFQLPLGDIVREFTKLKGIPGAVRDAAPDAWGRRVIEHKLQRSPGDLEEIDYLLNGPQDGAGYLSFGTSVEPPASKRRYNRTHQLAELVAAAEAIEGGTRVVSTARGPATSLVGKTRRRSHRAVPAYRFQCCRDEQRRPSSQPRHAPHCTRLAPYAGVRLGARALSQPRTPRPRNDNRGLRPYGNHLQRAFPMRAIRTYDRSGQEGN